VEQDTKNGLGLVWVFAGGEV